MVMHRARRRPRRTVMLSLAGLLAVSGVVALGPAPSAQAATRAAVLTTASTYARAHGYHVGIAVLDTTTRHVYGSGYATGTFASESVVKVFIATRLLVTGRMHGTTRTRAYKMITQSDDAIASALYGAVGGDGLINWIKLHYHEPDLGSPPSRANWWGNTHIRPVGLVRLYAKLKADRRVGPWLLNAMHHATRHGSDGQYQFFGIPSASPGAAIKQGWGADYDDWSRSADFNTTGFVAHDRYAVAILARGPRRSYGARISAMLTAVARLLLPNGSFPDPIPTLSRLSALSGRDGGGTAVTITGTDFTGVRAVQFGATPARSFHTLSRSQIRVVTPAHPSGQVDVRVTTDHGATALLPHDRFRFVHAPAVTGLSSHSGPKGGGSTLVVSGSNFVQVVRVEFGNTPARRLHVLSPTRLQVTVPAHASGSVPVRVVTSYGTSPRGAAGYYRYLGGH